jgi:hypothetical protein
MPDLIGILVKEICAVKFVLSSDALKLEGNQVFLNVSFEIV